MDSGLPGENPHATHWEMPWVGLECAVSRHGSTLQTAAPPCQPSPLINWLSCPGCTVPERSRPSLHDSWLQLDRLHTQPARVTGDEHFHELRGTNKRRENRFFEAFVQQKIYDIFRFNGLSLRLTIIWMIWSCALEFFRNGFVFVRASHLLCPWERERGFLLLLFFMSKELTEVVHVFIFSSLGQPCLVPRTLLNGFDEDGNKRNAPQRLSPSAGFHAFERNLLYLKCSCTVNKANKENNGIPP